MFEPGLGWIELNLVLAPFLAGSCVHCGRVVMS